MKGAIISAIALFFLLGCTTSSVSSSLTGNDSGYSQIKELKDQVKVLEQSLANAKESNKKCFELYRDNFLRLEGLVKDSNKSTTVAIGKISDLNVLVFDLNKASYDLNKSLKDRNYLK